MTKSTRRALLSSVVALVLCLTMLIGTTFAWFTDTATTAVNTIQSGTLDVDIGKYVDEEWVSLEGETLDFVKAAGHENEEILWEPGCVYNLEEVVIRNNGNLALKYKVVISGINGDAKLNEAIEWTINGADDENRLSPGEKATLTISGHMKEDAGNEYQGLSIDGIAITVVATQDTVEYDSTTNEYDKYALVEYHWYDDGADYPYTFASFGTDNLKSAVVDSNVTFDNLYAENGYSANGHRAISLGQNTGDEAYFEDCIFLCDVGNVHSAEHGTITFKDCTFYGWVHFGNPTGANITFENCTFTSTCDVKIGGGAASVTFTDCTFDYKPTIVDDTTTYSYPMECGRIMIWSDATFDNCTILRDIAGDGTSTLTDCVTVAAINETITDSNTIGNAAYINCTFDDTTYFANSEDDVLIFQGCTFDSDCGNVYQSVINGTAIFEDCVFNAGFHIDNLSGADITIDNCEFNSTSWIKIGSGANSVVFKNTTIVTDTLSTPWGHQWIITYSDATFENCTLGRVIRAGSPVTITLDGCVDATGAAVTADQVSTNANPTVNIH